MIIGIDGNEANLENRVGVNQYAAELLNNLEKLPHGKIHKWIIYLKEAPLNHLPSQRPGWEYKTLPGSSLWIIKKLTPHLLKNPDKIDVFFAPSHYAPPIIRIPYVLSIMDLGYLKFPSQFTKYNLWQLKIWGGWSIKNAKHIIAISESTKNDLIKNYPRSKKKTSVTYLGFDRDKYNTKVQDSQVIKIKKKYKIDSNYLLYLGTLKPSKNIIRLIDAFWQISYKSLKLVIAGKKGWLYDDIFEKIKYLNLKNRVIFTDFIPEDDKPPLIKGAKAFVTVSFWEGFGIPVLEAMACGIPTIVSNVGSLPEVVGESSVLVNPNDTNSIKEGIEKVVLGSPDKYNKLIKAGLLQSEKFSWVVTADKTLKILENVKR